MLSAYQFEGSEPVFTSLDTVKTGISAHELRSNVLPRIQLDDEVLFDGQIDIFSRGERRYLCYHIVGVVLKPLRAGTESVGLDVCFYLLEAAAGILQADHHAGLDKEAGDVDLAAVDGEVSVGDKLAHFEDVVSYLQPKSSANQFEQALCDFAKMIGIYAERHDDNGEGPDVLWLLPNKMGLVIEAKSRKKEHNALTK